MKKLSIIYVVILTIILLVLSAGVYKFNFTNKDIYNINGTQINTHDATYTINGENVTLKNGISETKSPTDSASKTITRYFGNDLRHDLDGDGTEDVAFLLTQETGGSGVFYYVVALLNTANGPIGSDAVLLGDRIAPQNIVMDEGETIMGTKRQNVIVVNYADRNPGEPMTTKPSLGKSIWLKLDPKTMQFGEVAQNFEGEADISRMTLDTKTWNWVNTVYSDDKNVKPLVENKFTITFNKNGTFSATTDCNSVGGEYIVTKDRQITFSKMMSTLMYCENSQESDFTKMLEQTQSYMFTSKKQMVLLLKYDSGSVIFK